MNKIFYRLLGLLLLTLSTGNLALCAETGIKTESKIHVNQVGYLPEYPKTAIVANSSAAAFKVLNADTNEVVYQGALSAPQQDISSGDTVRKADFSKITTPGKYIIAVDGIGSSYQFKIADNVYYIPFIQTLRSYSLARSNIAINDPITGLTIAGNSHEKFKKAKLFFSDDVSTKGDIVDASGGWYDAGDYGKYVPTGAISTANILLAYELNPEKFSSGQLFFPEGFTSENTNLPDVLTEMKYELDWMIKMQRSDGAVYLKAGGKYWPALEVSPEQDTQNIYIYGLATYNTAMFGAANAMAARIYEKYDPEYAATLLAAAKKAYAYLDKHPEDFFRLDENQNSGSGPYDKRPENEELAWFSAVKKTHAAIESDTVDRIWLAAELFKTTGDKQYEEYLQSKFSAILAEKPKSFSWMDTLALGQWAYLTNEKANAAEKAKVQKAFLSYADDTAAIIAKDGYGCSLKETEYTWASSKIAAAKANMLTLAYQLSPKPEYINGALDQVHYILGRNTNGTSYLTGSGSKPAMHPHNRIHQSKGILVPGLIVGGPNNWPGGDPVQTKCITTTKTPPAKVYFDQFESYSTNEYAIDYIAPAAYILAYFSKPNPNLTPEDLKVPAKN